MSDKSLAKRTNVDILSGCQRFYGSVSIDLGAINMQGFPYMENILVGCWLVEIDLSSVSESCFTHIGDWTDWVDVSWEST